jgi:hypothetical protein
MRAQRVPAQAWEEVLILVGGDCLIDKERNMGNVSAGGFAFAGTSS